MIHNKEHDALKRMVDLAYTDIEEGFNCKYPAVTVSEIRIDSFEATFITTSSMLATALTYQVLVSMHVNALKVRQRSVISFSKDQKEIVAKPLLDAGVEQATSFWLAFYALSNPSKIRELLDESPDVESDTFPIGWERDYSPLDR